MAKVVDFKNNYLTLSAIYNPKIGDSVAINGACLTVVRTTSDTFSVELSLESQHILAIENYRNEVHIEPAMMMGDRFEGHIVQGHVDCLGTIKTIKANGNSTDFYVSLPNEYMKYIIPKGSVTIDGVSLTINEVLDNSFRLTIIPHTVNNTLFKTYKVGTKVNLETDMFARYIYNMFKGNKKEENKLSWNDVDKVMSNY